MAMVVTQTVEQGLNGLRWYRGNLRGGQEVPMPLAPGTPSLVVSVLAWPRAPQPVRLVVRDPEGAPVEPAPGRHVVLESGAPRSVVVNDPEEGTWMLALQQAEPCPTRLEVAAVAPAQDEPRESLLAAASTVPDDAAHSLPRGTIPLLAPMCVALQPLCGTRIDGTPPAIIAASDLTGAEPDALVDAVEGIPARSPLWRIAQALAGAAGI